MAKNYKIRVEYLKQLRDMFENYLDDPMVERDYIRIDMLIERLENDFKQEPNEDGIISQLGYDFVHWQEFRRYYPKLIKFYSDGLYFSEAVSPGFKDVKISNEDTVMLAREFFAKQGDFFVNHFDEFLEDDSEESIEFFAPSNNFVEETTFMHTTGDRFLLAADHPNIVKLTAFVHEGEHIIDNVANPDFFENTAIRETTAMFMELIATDYFNNLFGLSEQNLLRQYELLSIVKSDTIDAIVRNKMLKIYRKNRYYTPEHIYKKLTKKFNKGYVDWMADYSIYNLYNYQIPYLIAIELYKLYQVDRDKALNVLIDIILNGTPENIFALLAKYGISVNKHSHQYEDELCLKLGI